MKIVPNVCDENTIETAICFLTWWHSPARTEGTHSVFCYCKAAWESWIGCTDSEHVLKLRQFKVFSDPDAKGSLVATQGFYSRSLQ